MVRTHVSGILLAAVALVATGGLIHATSAPVGAVYVASNGAAGNEILVFERDARGALAPAGSVATGGSGTGAGLGNQGGLALSVNGRYLFAVNAGSDSLTSFAVEPDGLRRIDTVPSGGVRPISIALDRDLLYVLHAGGSVGAVDGVAGFEVDRDGSLSPIPGSFRGLSAASTGPAQAAFTPDGAYLVVTEKATDSIDLFPVHDDGTLGAVAVEPSVGMTPFGFDFGARGELLVSEAFGGAPAAGTVTSYDLAAGALRIVDPSEATTQSAVCWVAVSRDGRFAYTTNTASGTVTGFAIAPDGGLELLDADGVTATAGAGPIDLGFARDGRSLYVLNGGDSSLSAFSVRGDGSLEPISTLSGLPAGANGLAAR